MQIDRDMIFKAKETLGDRNAELIVETLGIADYDSRNMKCCCPFHGENHASFIYNPKEYNFHCFGACGRSYDLVDVFMLSGFTYAEACRKLFELAEMPYSFGELGVKTKRQYRYPKPVECTDKSKVYEYLGKRKISPKTIDYADVRQDDAGNIVFNYYDTNDVLTMVKYRPARKVEKGENKTWCQKDADTAPLLFNMNRINTSAPLICCEGEVDSLSAIEAGFTNAVSVPLGAGNLHWIEENFDFLEQFDSIIICADNDEAGLKMQKECVYRLGSWRTKVVDIPPYYEKPDGKRVAVKDLNEVLYWFGKEKVAELLNNAKDSPVPGIVDFSDIEDIDLDALDGIPTGMPSLDRYLMKLFYGTFNIVTGINGCVSGDTEYFNGYEWKPISKYCGDKVLQYGQDGSAELVMPDIYHKYPCDHFWHFKSAYGVDQVVSDEHNLVYLTSKGNLAKKNTLDFIDQHNSSKNGCQSHFITTFHYNGVGISLTDDEIRVMCAVVCDGSFTNSQKNPNLCRINIKKERKKTRLREILKRADIAYTERHYNPRDPEYSTFYFNAPRAEKAFNPEWYQCSAHQLEVFTDEILNWDGCNSKGRRSFSTTIKENADFVQFAFSATGRRSVVRECNRIGTTRSQYVRKSIEYEVSVTDQIYPSLLNVKKRIEIPKVPSEDGYKYCFTVPSGMLVLRHNGRINVTGNSGKSSFLNQILCQCLDHGESAYLYSGELPNFQSKNWLNFIFAGQRNVTEHQFGDSTYYKVTSEAKQAISDFYRGKLFIRKDGESNKKSDILKSMEEAVRKFGTKLIILDNMTSMNLENNDNNKFEKQAELVTDVINFAVKYNVAVILVVHPHKIDMMRRLNKMDVQGISALIDLAHRVISLYRVQEHEKAGEAKLSGPGWRTPPVKADVIIDILKDRLTGYEGRSVNVFYDRPSKRFFATEEELDHRYKWDRKAYQDPLPFPPTQLDDQTDEVFGKTEKEE